VCKGLTDWGTTIAASVYYDDQVILSLGQQYL